MASDANDPSARRRRIAEKGSDRLALITAGRAPPSSTSCPPFLTRITDEILPTDKDTGILAEEFHSICCLCYHT